MYPLGTLTQIFSHIRIPENLPRDMCSPLKVEPLVGGVYIAASEAAKEVVWLKNFLIDLEVVPIA